MGKTVRGCPTVQSQKEGTVESENNLSVPQSEEQADAKESEVKVGYKSNIYYEPDGPDLKNEPGAREGEKENANAE